MDLEPDSLRQALEKVLSPGDAGSLVEMYQSLTVGGSIAPHGYGITGDLLALLAIFVPNSVAPILEEIRATNPLEHAEWLQRKDELTHQLVQAGKLTLE